MPGKWYDKRHNGDHEDDALARLEDLRRRHMDEQTEATIESTMGDIQEYISNVPRLNAVYNAQRQKIDEMERDRVARGRRSGSHTWAERNRRMQYIWYKEQLSRIERGEGKEWKKDGSGVSPPPIVHDDNAFNVPPPFYRRKERRENGEPPPEAEKAPWE